ncbi:MAG: ATP-binding protein [Clostridia bacterium]|nr:ATP-binding protein [Clostridia bacterium]
MLYQNALEVIEKRRRARSETVESRKNEVYTKIPRIAEIERRLNETGMLLLSSVADEKISPDEAVAKIMAENRELNSRIAELLRENGYPENYLNPPFVCARCSDTGYDESGKLCSCLKRELTDRALSDANLTKHMAGQTFDKFDLSYYDNSVVNSVGIGARDNAKSILSVTRSFAENFDFTDKNLLFYGPSGLGKTFLSSAVAAFLIERGKDVLYISANSFFPMLENIHFGRKDDKSSYIADKSLDCELLVLDDLGAEFITQFTASELFRVMNMRLLSGKKMIFSTNLTLSELAASYSERIVSRLIGSFETLQFFGEDIRKKKKYEEK